MSNRKCPICGEMSLTKDGFTPGGKQRWGCYKGQKKDRRSCYTTTDPSKPARNQAGTTRKPAKTPIFKRARGKAQVFVVTCAQNGTPRHKPFYAALEQYCNHRNAELLVIPTRYKNPTSRWTSSQENADTWDVPQEHLLNTRFKLNRNIEVLGDIKTQPTAVDPLTGFESITAGESAILGHTKLQLRTVAAPQGRLPKILTTTGACTVPNYTDSKAGKLGEFHHTLGAAVVEVRGGAYHLRQINASKDGSFYDLETLYGADFSGGKPWRDPASRPLSLTMGDTHVRAIDKAVEKATFEGIIPQLKPKALVWHDLCDGYAFNHHAVKNPFAPVERAALGQSSVSKEVQDSLQYLNDRTPADTLSVIVPSNHNDFLQRWIESNDWRLVGPMDREFYLETALELTRLAAKGDGHQAERLNAYIYWAKRYFEENANVRVLDYDESCMLGNIEHGMHGHHGPNGSRGSVRNLRRIGVKSNTGHSHSPEISEGAYRAGTSTVLRMGYNLGPSSWLNTHILTYANSKRTLLNIIDGEWRL
jgi:hypothetical protein